MPIPWILLTYKSYGTTGYPRMVATHFLSPPSFLCWLGGTTESSVHTQCLWVLSVCQELASLRDPDIGCPQTHDNRNSYERLQNQLNKCNELVGGGEKVPSTSVPTSPFLAGTLLT